ncbi:MAG: PHP domain-containing protein [Polyangiaceae bacterium]|nr:PHP domain-containing protein [Polyangiaceae bacterium]
MVFGGAALRWIGAFAALSVSGGGCASCGEATAAKDGESTREAPVLAPPVQSSSPPAQEGVRFLKGQLHAHSNASGDSDTPAEEVAAWYARRGYDFLVFTDHNRITDTPDSAGLLTIPGVELTQNLSSCEPPPEPGLACLLHVNALFIERAPSPRGAGEAGDRSRLSIYAKALEIALDMGAVAQLNHPNFHYGADAGVLFELSKRGLGLVEIANQAADSANEGDPGHPSTEALWDEVLTRGGRLFATATDDAHHYADAEAARARGEIAYVGDLGFVMVRAQKTAASIRAAIASGDFYSSTGVLLDRLDMDEDEIAVDVKGGGEGTLIEVIGTGGAIVAAVRGAALRFHPKSATQGYLRVRITDGQGRRAWSQPLFRVDDKDG